MIHIVLILSDTDGFRIYFHEFCQRIGKTATYRNSATNGYVIFRKFFPRCFACGIHRSSGLGNHKNLRRRIKSNFPDKKFSLAACGTVTNGNRLNFISAHHRTDFFHRHAGFVLRCMRINSFIVQQISIFIQTNHFTAAAVTGIDGENTFFAQRWCQQELPEVFRKNRDGFFVGFCFGFLKRFIGYCRFQKPFVTVFYG